MLIRHWAGRGDHRAKEYDNFVTIRAKTLTRFGQHDDKTQRECCISTKKQKEIVQNDKKITLKIFAVNW